MTIFMFWMFGNNTIFAYDENVFASWTTTNGNNFLQSVEFILQRVFGTWYYSSFFVLFLIIWVFKQVFYNCIAKNFMDNPKSCKEIEAKEKPQGMTDTNFINSFVSTKSLTDSYKIENNPDYVEVL